MSRPITLIASALATGAAFALTLAPTPASAATHAASAASEDGFHFVLFASGDSSSSINSTTDDFSRAQALRGGRQPLLYFRQRGAAYVIRDPATLDRANKLLEPQRVLGERQGALGEQQGELGRRQGELGRQQARLGAMQGDENATLRQITELAAQQAALGRDQAALGAQQAALGARQAELGARQAQLSQIASVKLRDLVGDAMRRGLAQRVN
jgi:hypothetical protein